MTDLSRLKVSLTKHNAHKIAPLLKKYKASSVLSKLSEVHAETVQAHKNLSVQNGTQVPKVWAKVRKLGGNAVDALVLVGIIFSHHELILAMSNASSRSRYSGRIERNVQLTGKAYTNFVQIVDQLGYATKRDLKGVTFNLRSMFSMPGLGPLVGELLKYKLIAANWNQAGTVADEAIALSFQNVFGVTDKEFRDWITVGAEPLDAGTQLISKDEEFFDSPDEGVTGTFAFKPGHEQRSVDPVSKKASAKTKANQLHNDIQNRLYEYLKAKIGAPNVGTELDTGSGTAIDLATKQPGKLTFYEIKTSSSVRSCIRQAIPQLLEYAYWPAEERADELVIVSHLPITKAADKYLAHLRDKFELPITYRQFSLTDNRLI
ncbi:hypothetical protein MQC88_03195 [Luteimonas sp. 50]|uniref:Protein NO VEIN C-terminal domain-containing protein n=1 Tax=Cognatiluteimonas sedimenti TaxID=2927791 RepID=A0ABT0A1W8_9GAMM|nr:hypothetical protein [Lysobacter sedimenti]MCJ0824974.1 hypothetical protein [Lysobacter sedimenti]